MMRNDPKTGNTFSRFCLALLLCLALILPLLCLACGAQDESIRIRTPEDLIQLAQDCRLDSWSQGKTVLLEEDLVLDETACSCLPIPSFSGVFDGGGHTISGLVLSEENPDAGLFGILEASAVVKDLTVVGQLTQEEESLGGIAGKNYGTLENCTFVGALRGSSSVGGIVGINGPTGQVLRCRFQGAITGEHFVGGIAGQNSGSLVQCENSGEINTSALELSAGSAGLSLTDSSLSLPSGTDIGGIAGFSDGLIQDCRNTGNVGYEHMNYNVGGIVGRQSGLTEGCSSSGTIQGRKDVGGIAGQLEPRLTLQYTESSLDQLWGQLDTLQTLMEQALEETESLSGSLSGSISGLLSEISVSKEAVDTLRRTLSGMVQTPAQSAEQAADQLDTLGSTAIAQSNALDASLSRVLSGAAGLQQDLAHSSGALAQDLQAISAQAEAILHTLQEGTDQAQSQHGVEHLLEDVSAESSVQSAYGRITGCENLGAVFGDRNVAGIAGALSIEYDFDPEDDLMQEGVQSLDLQYQVYAVISNCRNQGTVQAKKDCAGGIVGRMDLGAVRFCESYGPVFSSTGGCVGGIAGQSQAVIRDCFVKCTLEGSRQIGGVIGCGGENSLTSGCYTLVQMTRAAPDCGAISGNETGQFSDNYFVSDTLAGLGRVSYAGQAQPISFDQLSQVSGLPQEMTQFTLRFLVEGEEIKSLSFSYGDSFDESVYPQIPQKEGFYACWDVQQLTNLCFDQTVTAEYTRSVLTLSSEAARSSGRPVFLAEGTFDPSARLTVRSVQSGAVDGQTPLEHWQLELSGAQQESYTLRYLSPSEDPEQITVYLLQEGRWEPVETSVFGSYLVFPVPSAQAELAILPARESRLAPLALLLAAAVLAVILIALHKRRSGCKKTPSFSSSEPVGSYRLPASPRLKKRALLAALAVLVCAALAVWAALTGGRIAAAADAYQLLEQLAAQPESTMTLTLDAQLDQQLTHQELEIAKTQAYGQPVVCVQNQGLALYYVEDAVLLASGKAYQISALYPDYSVLAVEAARLYRDLSFSANTSGGQTVYSLTVKGENAQRLLALLLPGQAEELSETLQLTLELTAQGQTVLSLCFSSQGTLSDPDRTPYSIQAQLIPQSQTEELTLPQPVLKEVQQGQIQAQTLLSEDLFRLIRIWTQLKQQPSFSAELMLTVDCGPLSVDQTMRFDQMQFQDQRISSLRSAESAIYFSQGSFCSQTGAVLNSEESLLAERAGLLELIRQIALNGEYDCMTTGDGAWLYTLRLDQQAMEDVALAAAPELDQLPLTLTYGSLQILVQEDGLQSIRCDCTGGLDALAEFAPATISAELRMVQGTALEIPAAVKDQLLGS